MMNIKTRNKMQKHLGKLRKHVGNMVICSKQDKAFFDKVMIAISSIETLVEIESARLALDIDEVSNNV